MRTSAALLLAATAFASQLQPIDQTSYRALLHAHRGHVLLVDFWATWCDSCREELPRLVTLAKKLDPNKFQLVTISADEPEQEQAAAAFLDKLGVTGVRYLKRVTNDSKFIDSVDPKWSGALPAIFLYDAQSNRAAALVGDSTPEEIDAAIRKLIPTADK